MQPEQWSRLLTASVAPVVVISASALLCLAFYNRLAAIVLRLRAVQRERLDIQDRMERATPAEMQRGTLLRHTTLLESLSSQTVGIVRRARLIRATLLAFLVAICLLVVTSLLNGLTVLLPSAMYAAVGFFIAGMLSLLLGVGFAMTELIAALSPAELESHVVSELTGFGDATTHPIRGV